VVVRFRYNKYMVKVQHFGGDSGGGGETDGGNNFEKNIAHAGEQVTRYRENNPAEVRGMPEREQVKTALKGWGEEQAQAQDGHSNSDDSVGVSPPRAGVVADDGEGNDEFLPDYLKEGNVAPEAVEQVRVLLDMATRVDIERAIKEARGAGQFVEDAFHDALVDKILPVMKEKGLI